jgi:hypothetical protein
MHPISHNVFGRLFEMSWNKREAKNALDESSNSLRMFVGLGLSQHAVDRNPFSHSRSVCAV